MVAVLTPLLLGVMTVLMAPAAQAMCVSQTVAEQVKQADAVFVGTARSPDEKYNWQVDVSRVYKGGVPPEVLVDPGQSGEAGVWLEHSVDLRPDVDYVFFVSGPSAAGVYATNECAGTKEASEVVAALDQIAGPADPPVSGRAARPHPLSSSASPESAWSWPVVAGAAVVIGVALLLALHWRSRGD